MKTIKNWHDLGRYGINALTGEACRVGARILCDLTPQGRDIVSDLFGFDRSTVSEYLIPSHDAGMIFGQVKVESRSSEDRMLFAEDWNGGKSCGSIMLPYGLLTDLALWCLLLDPDVHVAAVIRHNDGYTEVVGFCPAMAADADSFEDWQKTMDWERKMDRHVRLYKTNRYLPGSGTRCEHQMSGRVE